MAFITVNYAASASSAPAEYHIQDTDGMTIGTFLEELQGVSNFANITVENNGVPASLSATVQDGDTIVLVQKKTDSGII